MFLCNIYIKSIIRDFIKDNVSEYFKFIQRLRDGIISAKTAVNQFVEFHIRRNGPYWKANQAYIATPIGERDRKQFR